MSVIDGVYIETLAFGEAGRVFAGTDQGVYRTDDVGAGWQAAGLDSVDVLDLLCTTTGALIVASGHDVFRSDDDGATWHHLAAFDPGSALPFWSASLVEHPEGDVYIGTAGLGFLESKKQGVYRLSTSDSLMHGGLDKFSVNALVVDEEGRLVAATSGLLTGVAALGPAGVFRYLVDQDVWIPAGLSSTLVIDLVMTARGAYVAGTWGLLTDVSSYVGRGLVRAPGGNDFSWTYAGQGIPAAETYTLATGDVWTPIYIPSPDDKSEYPPVYTGIAIHPEGDIFLRRWTGNLLRSQDRGTTWTELPVEGFPGYRGPPMRLSGQQPYHHHRMVIAASGTVLVGDKADIWRSPDRGETWEQRPSPMPGTPVIALAAAPTGRLFALTSQYMNTEETSVFTSDDDGLSWTLQAALPQVTGLPQLPYTLSLVTNAEDQLFALVGGYGPVRLFHVKEEDDAWTVENITSLRANDLAIDADGVLYAGSIDDPVLSSKDEGRTWQPLVDGAHLDGIMTVAVDADGNVYVGTARNGVFRSKTGTETTTETGVEVPAGLALEPGYPNPFTRTVALPFVLAQPAPVTLIIYDLLGRKVATLMEGDWKQAGRHEVRWDAAGQTGGVYVYKLIANGAVKAGRMVLVK